MTIATQRLTLSDYLAHVDSTDMSYELVNGELIPMTIGMGQRSAISDFTNFCFRQDIKRVHHD